MEASAPIHVFLEFLIPVVFLSQWLLSHITIVETMESIQSGMNPVTMTIINPHKNIGRAWGSHQQPPVLKSCTLLNGQWGLDNNDDRHTAISTLLLTLKMPFATIVAFVTNVDQDQAA